MVHVTLKKTDCKLSQMIYRNHVMGSLRNANCWNTSSSYNILQYLEINNNSHLEKEQKPKANKGKTTH